MKRLWRLSLAALLLGNAIDGIATHLEVQQAGIKIEHNPFARWMMGHLGLLPQLILIKLVLGSLLLLIAVHWLRSAEVERFGFWVGTGVISILNLYLGILLAVGGTGWGSGVLKVLVPIPTRIIDFINHFSRGWIGWTIVVAGEVVFLIILCVYGVRPALLLLDRKRQSDKD